MKEFVFNGHSDDTFGEYKQTNDDHDNCASGEPILYELKKPDGAGILVSGTYSVNGTGCWMIGASLIDEDKPVDWKITMNISRDKYFNEMVVEASDDAELTCITRINEENQDD